MWIRCDEPGCGWSDKVTKVVHMRAWYFAPCPECSRGEIIDEREVRIMEEVIRMETEGLVTTMDYDEPTPEGMVRATINTGRDKVLEWTNK
jgi:hypothetical protein